MVQVAEIWDALTPAQRSYTVGEGIPFARKVWAKLTATEQAEVAAQLVDLPAHLLPRTTAAQRMGLPPVPPANSKFWKGDLTAEYAPKPGQPARNGRGTGYLQVNRKQWRKGD